MVKADKDEDFLSGGKRKTLCEAWALVTFSATGQAAGECI